MLRTACLVATIACAASLLAWGDVPPLINYQGKLLDKLNKPVDGIKAMTFEFYDDETAGELLFGFSEMQNVTVTKGIFNVLIGSATEGGVPVEIFGSVDAYLRITVGGEALSPRPADRQRALCVQSAEC